MVARGNIHSEQIFFDYCEQCLNKALVVYYKIHSNGVPGKWESLKVVFINIFTAVNNVYLH